MTPQTRKTLWIIIPFLLVGGVVVYASVRKKRGVPDPGDAVQPALQPADSIYPLKKGSNNSKVTELQKLLGVAADGIFGSQTEAALVAKAGMTSVSNASEFDQVKKAVNNAVNLQRAQDMVTKFKTGLYSIMAIVPSVYNQVIEDYAGALTTTGKALQMKAGKYVSKTDYLLVKTTKSGNVLMQVPTGANAGTYSVDPATITLVKS